MSLAIGLQIGRDSLPVIHVRSEFQTDGADYRKARFVQGTG